MSSLDSHTLQCLRGCDVEPDGRLLRWYDQFAYDGVDLCTLNQNLSSLTAGSSTEAQRKLEAYLKDDCSELLQKYLEKRKERMLHSGAGETNRVCFLQAACWEFGELHAGWEERTWSI